MNKQEALKKLEGISRPGCTRWVVYDEAKELIKQIDGPERPVVPQFVAEHIEYHKSMNSPMGDIFNRHFIDDKRVEVWLREALNAYDNLGKAWLFGYEVEKEPIYVIRSKGTTNKYGAQQRLCHSGEKGNYFWCGEFSKFKHKFTRKELEQAGFGWVFDCEGVEVREVE